MAHSLDVDARASTVRAGFTAARPKILIVDEAAPVQGMLLNILQSIGKADGDVAIATTAEEALAWFGATPPDLVFTEFIGVHPEDGLEIVHEMLDRAPKARIVLVTSEPRDSPEVRAALRAGVFAVVEKPIRQEKIEAVLRDIDAEGGNVRRIR